MSSLVPFPAHDRHSAGDESTGGLDGPALHCLCALRPVDVVVVAAVEPTRPHTDSCRHLMELTCCVSDHVTHQPDARTALACRPRTPPSPQPRNIRPPPRKLRGREGVAHQLSEIARAHSRVELSNPSASSSRLESSRPAAASPAPPSLSPGGRRPSPGGRHGCSPRRCCHQACPVTPLPCTSSSNMVGKSIFPFSSEV